MIRAIVEGYGDWWSAAGCVVGVVGFIFTVVLLFRSKSVIEAARDAARATSQHLERNMAIAEISQAGTIMEEIKRLQREGAWRVALDRYSPLRKVLTQAGAKRSSASPGAATRLQGALNQVRLIEEMIEKELASEKEKPQLDRARINTVLSDQVVKLDELVAEIIKEV